MSERENEWKPLSGFSIQHYCDAVSMLLPSLLYEAQIEGAKRDTQFAGFAKLLWEEIGKMQDAFCEECGTGPRNLARDMERAETVDQSVQKLIARRAYDLVNHAVALVDPKDLDVLGFEEAVWRIPDMTAWVEEGE